MDVCKMNCGVNTVVILFVASYFVSWNNLAEGSDDSFEVTKECSTYMEKLVSFPDLRNMVRYKNRRHPDFEIDTVKNTDRERSFYWCELNIEESDTVFRRYRHFGFNTTHWWVEKGCGGWFYITECKPAVASQTETGTVSSFGDTETDQRNTDGNSAEDPDDEEAALVTSARLDGDKVSVSRTTTPENLVGANSSQTRIETSKRKGSSDPPRPTRPIPPPGNNSSSMDEMYRSWPSLGYHYPTTLDMWDVLDKATWVDVKAQLGFYAVHGGANSNIFDG